MKIPTIHCVRRMKTLKCAIIQEANRCVQRRKQLNGEHIVGGHKWSALEFLVKYEMSWAGVTLIFFFYLTTLRQAKLFAF